MFKRLVISFITEVYVSKDTKSFSFLTTAMNKVVDSLNVFRFVRFIFNFQCRWIVDSSPVNLFLGKSY